MSPKPLSSNPMNLVLGNVRIALQSESDPVIEGWNALFGGWEAPSTAGASGETLSATVRLTLVPQLPALPEVTPVYRDGQGIVDVYAPAAEQFVLHYLDGALVTLWPASGRVEGIITERAMRRERLEDVTFTSLAPLFRRRGWYMLHAFAAVRDGRALLLVGPSGSGKTTTGLGLILAGWQLLANDVVLLHRRRGVVYAYPTPGALGVRPPTLSLLPELRKRRSQYDPALNSFQYRVADLSEAGWAAPAPVAALCFPQVCADTGSELLPATDALTLARLLEESVDRWDRVCLTDHVSILQALSSQAGGFRLHLGPDVARLPDLLARTLSGYSQ